MRSELFKGKQPRRNGVERYEWYEEGDAANLPLVSHNRGLTWEPHQGSPLPEKHFELKDSSFLRVNWKGYEQHPISEQPAYEKAGYFIYPLPGKDVFAIGGGFQTSRSSDGGRTWVNEDIRLPKRADVAGYGMATAKMMDAGTIVMPMYGTVTRRHRVRCASVIRSEDSGRNGELLDIAVDNSPEAVSDTDIPSGTLWAKFPAIRGFDEAAVLETRKPGRVIAVIEESWSKKLYGCVSEDSGLTWTSPRLTGMAGVNPLLLRLKSGAIACAYTNRYEEDASRIGMTVCYSHDDGETWDTQNAAILKDENARRDGQLIWNFLQFSDGSLYACGYSAKRGCGGGDEVGYAVGFRFTEDYRTPVRKANAKAKPAAKD